MDGIKLGDMTHEEIAEAIESGDIIVACPPDDVEAFCPSCQVKVSSVTIDTDLIENEDGRGVVHPCHCRITPAEFTAMVRKAMAKEA